MCEAPSIQSSTLFFFAAQSTHINYRAIDFGFERATKNTHRSGMTQFQRFYRAWHNTLNGFREAEKNYTFFLLSYSFFPELINSFI